MGHIRTPKFELQIERENGRVMCQGMGSISEASKYAFEMVKEGYDKIYLWGNSNAGKKYITSYPLNPDYFKWEDNKWISVSIISL